MTSASDRLGLARAAALEKVDGYFAGLIGAEIGPLGLLHLAKRAALSDGGPLVSDRDAIATRIAEQDQRLADIDQRRRAIKDRIRSAATVAEIRAMIEHEGIL